MRCGRARRNGLEEPTGHVAPAAPGERDDRADAPQPATPVARLPLNLVYGMLPLRSYCD
jgi:hypothetical protein